jgi:hypothetical protein
MKIKILIVLPLILTVGILLGHLMLVLGNPGTPSPVGHPTEQIGAGTFGEVGNYNFPGTSKVGIGTETPGYELDVRGTIDTTYLRVEGTGTALYVAGTAYMSHLGVGGLPDASYRINTPGDVKISGKLYTDYIQGVSSNLDLTLMPYGTSRIVQVGYGGTPRNFAVWGDTNLWGNLNVGGRVTNLRLPLGVDQDLPGGSPNLGARVAGVGTCTVDDRGKIEIRKDNTGTAYDSLCYCGYYENGYKWICLVWST